MIHDQGLVDQLRELAIERFDGEVFRVTGHQRRSIGFFA